MSPSLYSPRIRRGPAAVVVAIAAAAGAPAFAQATDVVRCRNGTEVKGRIEEANRRGVEIDVRRGVKRTLDWDEVAEIDWAGASAFEAAESDAKAGRVDDAIAALVPLAKSGRVRGPLRQEVLFTLANLQQRRGMVADALANWRELLADYPDGRYRDESVEGLVDALLATATPAEAEKALGSFVEHAKGAPAETRFDALASALRGRIGEVQRRFADARSAYESALRREDLGGELAARTRLGVARCLIGEGKKEEAKRRFRELVMKEAPPEVLAGAWNGLADLALDDGVSRRDAGTIEVALFSYLRGVVQYKPAEGERSPENDRALAGAARAFEYLAELSSDPAVKRLDRQRAAWMKQRLAAH